MTAQPRLRAVLQEVRAELERAERLWPNWPAHMHQQLGIVAEELGEVQKEVNNLVIHEHNPDACLLRLRIEAVQLAAMALRFLVNLPEVEP